MRQIEVLGKKVYTGLMMTVVCFLLFSSCKSDEDVDLSEEGTNEWIYKVMSNYYLWNEDLPKKESLNFSQSPEQFFESLLSDQDGVKFRDGWLTFSSIEKKKKETKSIDESDSYGFEFASYKSGANYYAWVLYVLPGSPAAEAGLKRGNWIIAVDSNTPNITNTSTFFNGSATSFLLARYQNKQFVPERTIQMPASRSVINTPFLKDSVYTINGKKIGYLVYSSFSSGPDDKDESYNTQMKQIFSGFKAQQVDEFVLDLRFNRGGLVTCAQLMTSLLAPSAALGKTFCTMEYNKNHEKDNKTLLMLNNSELQNANLDLKRIYVLTGNVTASASEAVINCLIPHMGRSNITIIGEKTIGKRVGSNEFGANDQYDWLLHPITLRIFNKDHTADYADGFSPDVKIEELVVGNEFWPLGDTNDMLLGEAISRITGQRMKSAPAQPEDTSLKFIFSSLENKKVKEIYTPF